MKLKQCNKSVINSYSRGFLILVLSLFLGTITSCDFKHSLQHQLGFETTSNQNISKTTINQSCSHLNSAISKSVQTEDLSQVKNKVQELSNQLTAEFIFADHTNQPFLRKRQQSCFLEPCPLFILYKRRKVLS